MDGEFLLGSGHLLATEGDVKSEHRDVKWVFRV